MGLFNNFGKKNVKIGALALLFLPLAKIPLGVIFGISWT